MPDLDVSDVLLDPDFAETLTVIRRQVTIDNTGVQQVTSTTIAPAPIGVVIPQNDVPIQRGPDQLNLPRLISVHTAFRLRSASMDASGNQFQPDLIVWNGDQYQVTRVYPFNKFGSGFVSADAASIDSVDQAVT